MVSELESLRDIGFADESSKFTASIAESIWLTASIFYRFSDTVEVSSFALNGDS